MVERLLLLVTFPHTNTSHAPRRKPKNTHSIRDTPHTDSTQPRTDTHAPSQNTQTHTDRDTQTIRQANTQRRASSSSISALDTRQAACYKSSCEDYGPPTNVLKRPCTRQPLTSCNGFACSLPSTSVNSCVTSSRSLS